MALKREQVLGALQAWLELGLSVTVRRNEVLPERVPMDGLVILRDDYPGEPEATLNLRTKFYSHRVELEALLARSSDGSGEAALDALRAGIAAPLRPTGRSAVWPRN